VIQALFGHTGHEVDDLASDVAVHVLVVRLVSCAMKTRGLGWTVCPKA
jgi:hypothetical protein